MFSGKKIKCRTFSTVVSEIFCIKPCILRMVILISPRSSPFIRSYTVITNIQIFIATHLSKSYTVQHESVVERSHGVAHCPWSEMLCRGGEKKSG